MREFFSIMIFMIWALVGYIFIENSLTFLLTTVVGLVMIIALDIYLINKERKK